MMGFSKNHAPSVLYGCSMLAIGLGLATSAAAQTSAPQAATSDGSELQDIVVTAQKREQRLQDVPIAITALTGTQLESNRIANVSDLSGLAPGLISRPATGGISIASFSMRGVTSYGVAPGSDKEISLYLDGVYLSSSRGSIFDLPDIERIEVLRGPQGTLFGRNATAGAISIVTRNPKGEWGLRQDFTVGNYDQMRSRTSVDFPSVGPFSAYVTYVHDERRGDIKNLGARTRWDRTGPNTGLGVQSSPRYLGNKNADNWFGAIRFEPSSSFSTTYKYDRSVNRFSPEGMGLLAYVPGGSAGLFAGSVGASAPFYASYFDAIVAGNDVDILTDAKRPKSVNNGFTTNGKQRTSGHSLTSDLTLSDSVSLRNVAAYRKSSVYAASDFSGGLSSLTIPEAALLPYAKFIASLPVAQGGFAGFASLPAEFQTLIANGYAANPMIRGAAGIGNRMVMFAGNNVAKAEQWSDELQLNYNSDFLDLTVGGIWFHSKDVTGGPGDIQNTFVFTQIPADGTIPLGITAATTGGQSIFYNKATSIAAYVQAEVHVTPQIDIVGGARITRDKKSGTNEFGGIFTPSATNPDDRSQGTIAGLTVSSFSYKKTKPNFSIGVNYKPNRDILVYGKYSTGFVSGGTVRDFVFEPETVKSWEGGIKADLFDRRLRTNLAVWHASYDHLQSAQGGQSVGRPELSVVVADIGKLKAKGAELEVTAALIDGLSMGGSLSYTTAKYLNPPAYLLASAGGAYVPTLIPKWTGTLFGEYTSAPLFDDAHLVLRVDGIWRSKMRTDANPNIETILPLFANTEFSPESWIVNSRLSLRNIASGVGSVEVSLWARNLTDNKATTFPSLLPFTFKASSFQQARTYGLDVSFRF